MAEYWPSSLFVFLWTETKSTCSSSLLTGDALIERVSQYNLQGVIVSDDLSWTAHCEYIYDKATKRFFLAVFCTKQF